MQSNTVIIIDQTRLNATLVSESREFLRSSVEFEYVYVLVHDSPTYTLIVTKIKLIFVSSTNNSCSAEEQHKGLLDIVVETYLPRKLQERATDTNSRHTLVHPETPPSIADEILEYLRHPRDKLPN